MALRVNFNPAAILAQAQLTQADRSLTNSIERLSSGLRITRAADDPAGLTIANILRHQLAALDEATTNTEESINLVQTAEGALDEISGMLLRMRQLAIDAANAGSNDDSQLQALQAELDNLLESMDRQASDARFGTLKLLDGSFAANQLSTAADDSLDAIAADATRLPGGIRPGSTLSVSPPSGNLSRERIQVTFLDGGSPAARTATIDGLTQNGVGLSVAGGESLTVTGPDGSSTFSLAATTTVGDLVAIVNATTGSTGLRADYDETTGVFALESEHFGSGALDVVSSDDLSGGSSVGLLDTDTSSAIDNPLRPARDRFAMTMRDGGLIPPATATLTGMTGNGTLLDAVDGGTFTIFGLGESATIDLAADTTIQGLVDAINATTEQTGAVATYNAVGTGDIVVQGTRGPLFLSSSDLTSGGSQVGILDQRTDLIDDVGGTRTSTAANVTADLTYTDANGTQRSVTLTQVPTQDGGRALVNLLPGGENSSPFTAYESGAFRTVLSDLSDGSIGSTITAYSNTLTATRRSPAFFQVGPRSGNMIRLEIPDMRSGALGRTAGLAADGLADLADLGSDEASAFTAGRAQEAISVIDAAIAEVSAVRGDLGAVQSNGLERTLASLRVASENVSASESRIRDVDFAQESARFAQFNIRLQAATAMLAQANQTPQSVLQLLQ